MKKPLVIDGGVRWAPVDEAFRDFPAARTEDRRAVCRQCGQKSHAVDGRSVHSWRQATPRETPADAVKALLVLLIVCAAFFAATFAVAANSPWPLS